jgi:hypothetical protein
MLIAPPTLVPQVTAPLPAAMPVILPQGAPATARQTQAAIAGTGMAAQVAQDQRSPSPALYTGNTAAMAAQMQEEATASGRTVSATHMRKDGKSSVLGASGAKAYGRAEERMEPTRHEGDPPPVEEITV